MTTPEREILAFIELNQPIAKGTIRDHFPQWDWDMDLDFFDTDFSELESDLEKINVSEMIREAFMDIENILGKLVSAGYVTSETRPTTHGQQEFYSIKETPR